MRAGAAYGGAVRRGHRQRGQRGLALPPARPAHAGVGGAVAAAAPRQHVAQAAHDQHQLAAPLPAQTPFVQCSEQIALRHRP